MLARRCARGAAASQWSRRSATVVLGWNVKHQSIMLWCLLALMAIMLLCSCLSPRNELRESAIRALESSVNTVGRFSPSDDQEDGMPERTAAWEPPAKAGRRTSPSPSKHGPDTKKTALYRKRPTPLMQKRVAVRYGFKCALCGKLLDDTWETDHVIPLNTARSDEEAERLNSIENLQPVHRACHQIKTSREAR